MICGARERGENICKVGHHHSVVRSIVACNAEDLWMNGESLCPMYQNSPFIDLF